MTCNQLDVVGVLRGRGAKDHEIRLRRFQATMRIGEHAFSRNLKLSDRLLHAPGLGVTDARDLHAGMFGAFTQKVTHVHVIEIQANDSKFFHGRMKVDAALRGNLKHRDIPNVVPPAGSRDAV